MAMTSNKENGNQYYQKKAILKNVKSHTPRPVLVRICKYYYRNSRNRE